MGLSFGKKVLNIKDQRDFYGQYLAGMSVNLDIFV